MNEPLSRLAQATADRIRTRRYDRFDMLDKIQMFGASGDISAEEMACLIAWMDEYPPLPTLEERVADLEAGVTTLLNGVTDDVG